MEEKNMEENVKMAERAGQADAPVSELADKMASIAQWTAPCTFARTEKAPIDSKSVFPTYDELIAYINDPVYGTAYPGQIVAVVSSDDAQKGAYILMSNRSGLVPMSLGGATASAQTVAGGGTCSCKWVVNPTDVAEVLSGNWVFGDGVDHSALLSADLGDAKTAIVQVDGADVVAYRKYTPAHTEDASGNWVDGSWSDWRLYATNGDEIVLASQKVADDATQRWVLTTDGGETYYSEQQAEQASDVVVLTFKSSDMDVHAVAVRDWVRDA